MKVASVSRDQTAICQFINFHLPTPSLNIFFSSSDFCHVYIKYIFFKIKECTVETLLFLFRPTPMPTTLRRSSVVSTRQSLSGRPRSMTSRPSWKMPRRRLAAIPLNSSALRLRLKRPTTPSKPCAVRTRTWLVRFPLGVHSYILL